MGDAAQAFLNVAIRVEALNRPAKGLSAGAYELSLGTEASIGREGNLRSVLYGCTLFNSVFFLWCRHFLLVCTRMVHA